MYPSVLSEPKADPALCEIPVVMVSMLDGDRLGPSLIFTDLMMPVMDGSDFV